MSLFCLFALVISSHCMSVVSLFQFLLLPKITALQSSKQGTTTANRNVG